MSFSPSCSWNASLPLISFSWLPQGRGPKRPDAAEDAALHQSFLQRGGREGGEDGHAEGVALGDPAAQAQEPRRLQQQAVADGLADDPPQHFGLGVWKRGAGGRAGHQIRLRRDSTWAWRLKLLFFFPSLYDHQHVNMWARGADGGLWEILARRGLFVVYRAITPAVLCYRVHYFFIETRQVGSSYVC